jgi:hypothetical protein
LERYWRSCKRLNHSTDFTNQQSIISQPRAIWRPLGRRILMRKERIEATNDIANQLFAVEEAIDVAITQAAKLSAMMPEARLRVKVSASMGHDALKFAGKSLSSLIESRESVVLVHEALDQVKTDIGLRTYGIGAGYLKRSAKAAPLLEVVSHAA